MTTASTPLPSDRHWATVDPTQLPGVCRTLQQRYRDSLEETGRLFLWRRAERTYYGEDEFGGWKESAAVNYGGQSGEVALIRINEFRSIIQGILVTATSERPALYAKAINSDSKSLIEAPIATGIVMYYYAAKAVDDLVQRTAERGLVLGEGFIHNRWDTLAGKPIGVNPETGGVVFEGDLSIEACSPLDVVRDPREAPDKMTWCMVAHRANVWDLAAAYPHLRDRILAQRGSAWWPETVWQSTDDMRDSLTMGSDPDRVAVWCVYHKKTVAVPNGLYAIVFGDLVLAYEPLKLDEIPVYDCTPAKHMDKNEGNSQMWDLLAPQEAYDAAWSSILTVHDAYTLGNLYVPKGSGITPAQIAGGQRLVEFNVNPNAPNGGMPMAVNYLTLPTAAYEFPKSLRERMQTLSGLNSVARGEVDDNVKSGTMAALIQSLAVKFNGGVQRAVVRLHEKVATGLLKQVKLYSQSTLTAEIVGSGGAEYLQSLKPGEMENVQRVLVEPANPLTQQIAGRLELADKLAEKFPGKVTMEQFVQVIESGELKPLFKRAQSLVDHIAQENDLLKRGELPPVAYQAPAKPAMPPVPGGPPMPPTPPQAFTCHPADDHHVHVTEHQTVLTLQARSNPAIRQAVEKHLADHYKVWAEMPPDLAALTGQSLPPPSPMMPEPQGEEKPSGGPPKKDGPDKPEPEKARPLGGAPQSNMPSMPRPAGGGPPAPA